MVIADNLVSFMISVLIRSDLKSITTNVDFIGMFMDENLANGELCYAFTTFSVAYGYLMELEPGSSLITTLILDDFISPLLTERISMPEYKGIIGPLNVLIEKSGEMINKIHPTRKKVLRYSATLVLFGLIGVGVMGIFDITRRIISGKGDGFTPELREIFEDIESYVKHVNDCILRKRGVVLLSPLLTNSIDTLESAKASGEKMCSLTWIIKSTPKEKGEEERNSNENDD